MRKRIIIGTIVLVVVIGALLVLLNVREATPEVTVVPIVRENLGATVTTNGKIEPVEPFVLRAKLDTFVEKVMATAGSTVRAGETLLSLDVTSAAAALARAKEDVLAAEEKQRAARAGGPPNDIAQLESDIRKSVAELIRLKQEHDALARLVAKEAATQDELDQSKLALTRAEAQAKLLREKRDEMARRARLDAESATLDLERARNEVSSLEEKVRGGRLSAPLNGTVYLLPVRARDFVHTGDVLAEVADLSRVRVRAFVDEPELGGIETGQAVDVTWDAKPGRVWKGRTETIPRAVIQRGNRFVGEALCSVENDRLELLPNTNVNLIIHIRERTNILTVPRGAVRAEGTTRYVYLLEGSQLKRRDIQIGIASATKFEVLQGLKEKDRVAMPSDVELRDGLEVRAVEPK